MTDKANQVGFEYYLDRLQSEKESAWRDAPNELLRILAREGGGSMRLYELGSKYLPYDAPESEIVDFMDVVKSMNKAGLITLELAGDPESKGSENIMVKLTPSGERIVEELRVPPQVQKRW